MGVVLNYYGGFRFVYFNDMLKWVFLEVVLFEEICYVFVFLLVIIVDFDSIECVVGVVSYF